MPAAERILQIPEDGTEWKPVEPSRTTPLGGGIVNQVCEAGAQWIRIDFKELNLSGYDSLVLTSSNQDRLILQGTQWNGRSFTTRALRGQCVTLQPYFSQPTSRVSLLGYQFSRTPLASTHATVAGAGDICDSSGNACQGTSDLIVAINPHAVFTAGDNAYSSGTLAEYNARYAPTWGRFKELTSPTPGNHEYYTSNAKGYFDYFNGVNVQTGIAGDRSKGYYSWDVGEWHFIALNTMGGGSVSSTQMTWLKNDLAANTKPCTAAYFHHPLVSRGAYSGYSQVKPIWDALYAAKADLVLVGHDHNYQRYAKMNPAQQPTVDGIRQILVGTGGRALYRASGSHPLLEAINSDTFGVLRLTLSPTGYTGDFMPRSGIGFTDHFSGTCNNGELATQAITLSALRDVTVKSGGTRVNAKTVQADGRDGTQELRGLMGWDVSAAAGLNLTAATVRMKILDTSPGAYNLYQAIGHWDENTATYAGTTPGTLIGTIVPRSTGVQPIALNAAGIELVKKWASGAVRNDGVILVAAANVQDGVDWYSREGGSAAQLVLEHTR